LSFCLGTLLFTVLYRLVVHWTSACLGSLPSGSWSPPSPPRFFSLFCRVPLLFLVLGLLPPSVFRREPFDGPCALQLHCCKFHLRIMSGDVFFPFDFLPSRSRRFSHENFLTSPRSPLPPSTVRSSPLFHPRFLLVPLTRSPPFPAALTKVCCCRLLFLLSPFVASTRVPFTRQAHATGLCSG